MTDFNAARATMVDSQLRTNKVTDLKVIESFETIPREVFLPETLRGIAYVDEDLAIGDGRYVMEPMVLARLIQAAAPTSEDIVLEVGAARGYGTAILAQIAATVVGLDSDEALVETANETLNDMGIDNAVVVTGAMTAGYAKQAPYDVILFSGAVTAVPASVIEQLAEGGRLAAVIQDEGGVGRATLMQRVGANVSARPLFDASTPILSGFERKDEFVF
ncbi:protein-L-isoaspartate O-methyltransferase family protein [Denitrobaculum tricleocarpae]|uniref:Protein-L-isoaspartate O-methyltransferase n=1 Tax=Denitrobaculum tricleocarpae TaxID=2591009 RepID=A0A545TQ31_9PROT|nr:protein-L-isoaspartate O-methyltransferase [Denitrobaculum tricleocarpae]TQV79319.1 protein-L-isoaspartate O-methyltransferase [Denitrobaculum tricleocarpae]